MSDAPGPDDFVSAKVLRSTHERVLRAQAVVIRHGVDALPPRLAARLNAMIFARNASDRRVTSPITISMVVELALDLLAESVADQLGSRAVAPEPPTTPAKAPEPAPAPQVHPVQAVPAATTAPPTPTPTPAPDPHGAVTAKWRPLTPEEADAEVDRVRREMEANPKLATQPKRRRGKAGV